jgi:predicted heme/steroid binding protein
LLCCPLRIFFQKLSLRLLAKTLLFRIFVHNALLHLMAEPLPHYTRVQLALRNGQDRDEIWIAYKGIIYDVTDSKMWRNGRHYEHWAGQDLTHEFPDAPHDERVFQRWPAIGLLKG